MPKVIKDTLEFDSLLGLYDNQVLVESDIIVPEDKPDLLGVLAISPDSYVKEYLAGEGKLNIEGQAIIDILYSNDDSSDIERIQKLIDFSTVLEGDNIERGARYVVYVKPEHVDYKIINSRKINLKLILRVSVKVFRTEKKEVIVNAEDSELIQSLKKPMKFLYTVGQNSSEVFLKDQLNILDGESRIVSILRTDFLVKPEETRLNDNKVVVQGKVNCRILYKTEEGQFATIEGELGYSSFIDIPGALSYMEVSTTEQVIETNIDIKEDENTQNSFIDVEVVLRIQALVTESQEIEIPVDVYGIKSYVEPVTESFRSIVDIVSIKSQSAIKVSVELPFLLKKVVDVIVNPVITDYMFSDNKIIVEGILDYSLIYLDEGGKIKSYSDEYPFKTFVENYNTEGSIIIDIEVNYVSFEILAMKEIEVKFIVDTYAEVFEENEYNLIVDVNEVDLPRNDDRHSIVIYIVQKGESLWDIAKRYMVSINDILEANEIDGNEISEGMKLIIPNKSV
ncbi:MAG: DUF3794 and LysM peptidoglycan-binding domain-containing protein [Thermoanaerobacteraceae bacterium]